MKKYLLILLLIGQFGNAQYNLFARQNFAKPASGSMPLTGLISYYKLDSNALDYYSSNNSVVDTDLTYVSGKVNNAVSLNGTSSKINFGIPTDFNISIGTLSAWIKTSGAGASYRSIFCKDVAWGMFLLDGVFGTYSWGSPVGFKSTGVNLNDGNWHHVVFVFDSGTANNYLYIDSVLALTTSMSIGNLTQSVFIGGNTVGQNFNGIIDEVSIYNVKLTQTDIDNIYNSGNGRTL